MINIRNEGEPVLYGLNLYPKNDPASKGFIFKIPCFQFRWRYSTLQKKHIVSLNSFEGCKINSRKVYKAEALLMNILLKEKREIVKINKEKWNTMIIRAEDYLQKSEDFDRNLNKTENQ